MALAKVSRPSMERLTDQEIRKRVREKTWAHDFEIVPGLQSGGQWPFHAKPACDVLGVPDQLAGKRALDVGAWDGPITFELERRGARAMALDIQDPSRVGFDLARTIIGSQALHYQASVYDLPFKGLAQLDLIVFRGVYYHLKYPILAFERLSAALKLGGTLHFEGEGLLNYVEGMNGQPVGMDVKALNATGAPICLSYPNTFRNSNNWFIPNPACLKAWLEVAGFEVRELNTWEDAGQRLYGWAVKVREPDMTEHVVL